MRRQRRATPTIETSGAATRLWRAAAALTATLVALGGPVLAPGPAEAAARRDPFPLIGYLDPTDCRPTCATGTPAGAGKFFLAPDRREIIHHSGNNRVNVFDASGSVPVQTDSIKIVPNTGGAQGFGEVMAYDARRHRLLVSQTANEVGAFPGCPHATPVNAGALTCPSPPNRETRVRAFDLANPRPLPDGDREAVLVAEAALPPEFNSHNVGRIQYDVQSDLLFVLSESRAAGSGLGMAWIHALKVGDMAPPPASYKIADPAPRDGYLWSYKVEGCVRATGPAATVGFGVTSDLSVAFLTCKDILGAVGGDRPAQHGLAVVDFNGAPVGVAGVAASFTGELYPMPGDFQTGSAATDAAGGRLATFFKGGGYQRMLVFDAVHRAWTGSVVLGETNVKGATIDSATGRIYTLDQQIGVIATDAAAVPVLQGSRRSLGFAPDTESLIFEPGKRWLIVKASGANLLDENNKAIGGTETHEFRVYQDRTSPYIEQPAPDPDASTADIDEEQAASVSHTGGGSAFGARAIWAGGTGATPLVNTAERSVPWSPCAPPVSCVDNNDLRPAPGSPTVFFGRVSEAQLAGNKGGGTAKASAVGAEFDETTEDDLDGKAAAPFTRAGSAPPEGATWEDLTAQVGEMNESACLDLGGDDDVRHQSHPGATVSCEERDTVTASGASSATMATLPVQVGYAASSVKLHLDEELGIVSEAVAIARDVHIGFEAGGSLSIGEVRSVARTQAKGRPGTAASKLETTVSYVRGVDPQGNTYACDQCDPNQLASVLNARFKPYVHFLPPRPATDEATTGSPGGARAVIEKDTYALWNDVNTLADSLSEVAGLTIVLYGDGAQASRFVVQLAAVSAESQYRIGAPSEPTVEHPASLTIELLDEAGNALAGGVFEVREDASGGLGDCLDDTTTDVDDAPDDSTDGDDAKDPADGDGTGNQTQSNHDTQDPDDKDPDDEGDPADGDEGDDDSEADDALDETVDPCPVDDIADDDTEGDDAEGDDAKDPADGEGDGTGNQTQSNHEDPEDAEDPEGDDTTDTTDDTGGDAVDELTDALVPGGSCVTGDDGVGDCIFEDLAPGPYIVTQTTAPAGFAPAADFPVVLEPGFATTVSFTNLKALATIEISLTDDTEAAAPLEGGEFVVLVDDGDQLMGDADVELGRCTTDAAGACAPFADVPLGAYVVHQATAPNGLMPADDVAFTLDQPGQTAVLAFVNGLAAVAGSPPPEVTSGGGGTFEPTPPRPSYGSSTIISPPPGPAPVVSSTPIPQPRTGLGRVLSLPSEAASFIARKPGDALLFGAVWSLLLAPAYLVARRRKLTLIKEGI